MFRFLRRSQTIASRLILAFAFIILLLVIQAAFAFVSAHGLLDTQKEAQQEQVELLVFGDDLADLRILVFKYLGTQNPTEMTAIEEEIDALVLVIESQSQTLGFSSEQLVDEETTDEQVIIEQITITQSLATYQEIITAHDNFRTSQANELINSTSQTQYEEINQSLDRKLQEVEADSDQQIDASNTQFLIIIIGLCLVSVLAAFVWGSFLIRSIAAPVRQLTESAERVSRGDLSIDLDISRQDEIGQLGGAFNEMVVNLRTTMASQVAKEYIEGVVTKYRAFVAGVTDGNLTTRLELNGAGYDSEGEAQGDLYELGLNLNGMVEGLSEVARQNREMAASISAAATEILAATTQQIASATEQDTAVTQTMTTVEEVVATVKQTAERAQAVANTSQQSVDVSREGQEAVSDSIIGMQLIRQRVEDIAENILALSARTQQIGEIIETVNEIADQSKLLALNASIEAARAGEEGKGFAVVAMEVRQLAEQSRDATARVRDILSEIQGATNTAVMVTEEGSKGADSGMVLVERAGEAIRDLAGTIDESAQAAQQIAASTQQQTNGMEQLAAAMTSIQQASTQAAASTRQAERSAQDLTEMSRQMEQSVARYQL